MNDDFFLENEDHDQDFSCDLDKYLESCINGEEHKLSISEEAYDYILDHFLALRDNEQMCNVGELAISKYPFSAMIFSKYCDALIIINNIDRALLLLEEKKFILDDFVINFLYTRANVGLENFTKAREYFALVKKHSPSEIGRAHV